MHKSWAGVFYSVYPLRMQSDHLQYFDFLACVSCYVGIHNADLIRFPQCELMKWSACVRVFGLKAAAVLLHPRESPSEGREKNTAHSRPVSVFSLILHLSCVSDSHRLITEHAQQYYLHTYSTCLQILGLEVGGFPPQANLPPSSAVFFQNFFFFKYWN